MTMGSIRVLSGICDDLMVPTVPTVLWLKQARKYDPKHVIMWLENSIELTEEYKDTILRLRKMGMRLLLELMPWVRLHQMTKSLHVSII